MPSLGADMEDGTFVEWHVEPGQDVTRGQVICVVETQKGAIDVEIWEGGVLAKLTASPGQKIPVGQVMALVATGNQSPRPRLRRRRAASLDRKRRAGRRSRGPRRWSPHRAPYPDRRSG
jgi:pyruvate dehydrogenase E2 component (dihydrolipoamide acetyltransferase)